MNRRQTLITFLLVSSVATFIAIILCVFLVAASLSAYHAGRAAFITVLAWSVIMGGSSLFLAGVCWYMTLTER